MGFSNTFWVFLGGSFSVAALLPYDPKRIKGMVCADSGANHTFVLGLIPDIIVGDEDSISPEAKAYYLKKGVEFMRHPREKNFSDGEAALETALARGATDLEVYGAFGNRADHTLANLFMCAVYAPRFASLVLRGDGFWARFLTGPQNLEIEGEPGDLVSILPLSPHIMGLSLSGFQYNLEKAAIPLGSTLTLSNVLQRDKGRISLEKGQIIIFVYAAAGAKE